MPVKGTPRGVDIPTMRTDEEWRLPGGDGEVSMGIWGRDRGNLRSRAGTTEV
jgi:hypothetical protein